MDLVNPDSLASTLDAINEALFFGHALTKRDRREAARWLAGLQGKPGAYAGMFAPVEDYRTCRLHLFTGEARASRGGAAHILGEEACRTLILLDVADREVTRALRLASEGMGARLDDGARRTGTYCCATCSAALWRHLAVGGLQEPEAMLSAGVKTLKARRDGEGGWRAFPFHYTLLALTEMQLPQAVEELQYAAERCERYLARPARPGPFAARRHEVARRVLEMV